MERSYILKKEKSIIKGVVSCKGIEKVVVIVSSNVFTPMSAVFNSIEEANNFFEPILKHNLFDDRDGKISAVSVKEFWRKFYEFRKEDSRLTRMNMEPLIKHFT